MWKAIAFLLRYSRRTLLLAALLGALGGAGTALMLALINRQLATDAVSWSSAGAFAALLAAVLVLNLASRVLLIRVMQRAEYDLRLHLARQILQAPLRHLEELGSSRLVAALTQDIHTLGNSLNALPNLCINSMMVIACLLYLGWLSLPVVLALFVFLALTLWNSTLINRKAGRLLSLAREGFDALMSQFTALTDGIKELKLHAARSQAFFHERLEPTAAALRQRNSDALTAYASSNNWMQMTFFIYLGLLVFGLRSVYEMDATLLASCALAIFFLRGPVVVLIDLLPTLGRAGVALRNLERLGLDVDQLAGSAPAPGPPLPPVVAGRIELRGITHTYWREQEEDRFTLGPIDFSLQAGELVFLVGGNGSGKTTLAKVLCGLYPPESGEVVMDGKPVGEESRGLYRQLFSAVFSEFFLFESLLGLAGEGRDAKVQEYLRLLQLDNKLRIRDGVLSTTELSRGQRKRLALLTAYLEDRPFYIFDEWAADQDPLFKEVFYRRLLPELRDRGKGVLVISHDIHYHDVADRVVRLDYGKLDETPAAAGQETAHRPHAMLALAPMTDRTGVWR